MSNPPNGIVLGLVGAMGSGKSRVAAELAQRGGYLISADQLGHEALRQAAIRTQILRRWGEDILSGQGEIDRGKLGQRVFADPAELRALERLVFPWIEKRLAGELARAKSDPAVEFIVLDAAIMLETGWSRLCDYLVFVDAPRPVRLERLARHRGWCEKDVEARERLQMSLEEKRSRADFVLDNSGAAAVLAGQIDDLLEKIRAGGRPHGSGQAK